ncbi:MAG: hypothetical protein ACR2M3_06230, partial [Thermomicrobiales bacterium]
MPAIQHRRRIGKDRRSSSDALSSTSPRGEIAAVIVASRFVKSPSAAAWSRMTGNRSDASGRRMIVRRS